MKMCLRKTTQQGGKTRAPRSRTISLVLLLRVLLVAEKHLPQLLADVAELVLVLAGELGNGGLREVAHHLGGEVAELVLLAQVSRDPIRSPLVELDRDVAEAVAPLARELEGLALGAFADLL